MNLIEAIKSGKKFRPKGQSAFWESPDEKRSVVDNIKKPPFYLITADEILGDWEIEEPTKSFTEAELREAFDATLNWDD